MDLKQWSRKVVVWLLVMALCLSPVFTPGNMAIAQAEETDSGENKVILKNPAIDKSAGMVVWDCVYFGNYWQSEYTPKAENQPEHGEEDVVHTDTDGTKYIVRKDAKCYKYEPVKWRVLSVNEDGTDVFLIADQVLDVAQYYSEYGVEITWANSDIRYWLGEDFFYTAFTGDEQDKILVSEVKTPDNPWSGEPGGNDTIDDIYLPSIDEMLNLSYGFSSDVTEGDTRRITVTDYAKVGGTPEKPADGFMSYWLRSPGTGKGCPAQVGHWGEGEILTEPSVVLEKSVSYLGVRPVMHVDLSDASLWSYAGKVTPKGVFVPAEEPELDSPIIKKLENKKGKKVTVTLSKEVPGAGGYQVAYAVKSSMEGQKTKSFKGMSVTVKGLKKKKTYYFRVRAYRKENGKTVYGKWGKKKSIKVKI